MHNATIKKNSILKFSSKTFFVELLILYFFCVFLLCNYDFYRANIASPKGSTFNMEFVLYLYSHDRYYLRDMLRKRYSNTA